LRGIDCYLLVAPAGGLDVWCAAGGGRFSIDSIVSILKTSRIAALVDHRRLLLPQLAANGIDVFELKRRTGWTGVFGPVRAEDVPQYLRTRRKTEEMTRVTFPPSERVEMAAAMWGSLSLRYTVFPTIIFGWAAAPEFIAAVAVLSLTTSLGCYVLPGTTFVQKTGLLGVTAAVALLVGLTITGALTIGLAAEAVVIPLLAAFLVGTAFPSYSPYWPCGYSKLFYGASNLELHVDEELCIGCRICDRVCPVECFSLTPTRKMSFADPEECVGCGACLKQCPTGAIVNQVADEQQRDAVCA
jgi:NAD-dependent dihydropyrimidine dehydrogenase PreA subunit